MHTSITFTPEERYEWSRRFVTVNYMKVIDKNARRKIAKVKHDDGREFLIPFESYMMKDTILGTKFLIQRVWIFNNLGDTK